MRYQWSSGEYKSMDMLNFSLPDYELIAKAVRTRNVSYETGMIVFGKKEINGVRYQKENWILLGLQILHTIVYFVC